MSPSANKASTAPRPRNRYRLSAYAAAAPSSRISTTDATVTIAELIAYCPRLPTVHASTHFERSIDSGGENGAEKMAEFVLNDDITIQISGKKNTSASTSSATLISRLGSRRAVTTPAPGRPAAQPPPARRRRHRPTARRPAPPPPAVATAAST